MPNWCTNRLEVYGSADELKKFKLAVVGTDNSPLSFHQLVPSPSLDEKTDLYEWCLNNWGTKFDLDQDTDVTDSPDQITYSFDSAWSPPIAWVNTASEMFPNLSLDLCYYELANGYAGEICFRNGHLRSMTELDCSDLEQFEEFLQEKFSVSAEELEYI